MKVKFAATPSWAEDNSIITIEADIEESISVGQSVKFELTDESWTERTIVSMEKWVYEDYEVAADIIIGSHVWHMWWD